MRSYHAAMRVLAIPALLLAACGGGGGGGTEAPPPPPPVVNTAERAVSGQSPFAAACGDTNGTVFVHSEVEPHLAVNPRDGNHLVAMWQQDRWANGAARGVLSAVSLDGGTTWTHTTAPFSRCSGGNAQNGGDFQRASDPWAAFSPDGTAWQMALALSGGTFSPGSTNAMLVSRSGDGGRTWSDPVALINDVDQFFNDKNTITADPADARFVYATWDRLRQSENGPSWFARSTDGGATWEAAREIYNPGGGSQTIGNLIRVLPDGALVLVFTQIDRVSATQRTASVRVMRSADRGASWSAPVTVSAHQAMGARDPSTGRTIRDGAIVPQMAAGPDGSLHVAWQDARFTGQRDAIAYSRSRDAGATWSAPVRVNSQPGAAAFTPQVHVLADGTVGVTFYDLRADTPERETLPTQFWIARSTDGVTWSETLVSGPFDLLAAPDASGLFLGDYTGLASAGNTFLALYARTTGSVANRTDVFFARVPPASPAASYAAPEAKRRTQADPELERLVSENIARALEARRVLR